MDNFLTKFSNVQNFILSILGFSIFDAPKSDSTHSHTPIRIGELITESVSCKSFVEPQIIEICEKIHSQRDSKPIRGGPGFRSLCEWIFSQISMI